MAYDPEAIYAPRTITPELEKKAVAETREHAKKSLEHAGLLKPTNPKDAVGVSKAPLSVLPFRVLWGVAQAFLEGALKYGRHNYRTAGVRASVYFDAVQRHMGAWWEGEDIDPDSGLSHIDKAIASLMVLRDGMYQGNWNDDRPPKDRKGVVYKASENVKHLLVKYPIPAAPHTEKNNG